MVIDVGGVTPILGRPGRSALRGPVVEDPPHVLHIERSVRRQEYSPGLCTVVSQRSRGGIYSVDGAEGTAVCPVPLHQVCVIL